MHTTSTFESRYSPSTLQNSQEQGDQKVKNVERKAEIGTDILQGPFIFSLFFFFLSFFFFNFIFLSVVRNEISINTLDGLTVIKKRSGRKRLCF